MLSEAKNNRLMCNESKDGHDAVERFLLAKGFITPRHLDQFGHDHAALVEDLHWRHPPGSTSPLLLACLKGRLDVLRWLWQFSGTAEYLSAADAQGCTPFMFATQFGHFAVMQWLFEHGAAGDVRTPCSGGATPMLVACRQGQLDVCQWLFDHGAVEDLTTRSDDGSTPLLVACERGHTHVARWLVTHGAAVDVVTANARGMTPFLGACYRYVNVRLCILLLRLGGAQVLQHDKLHERLQNPEKRALAVLVQRELALHDVVMPLVLWGMMYKRSGCKHLWLMGGETGLRRLVFGFVGVEVRRLVLENLRSSLEALLAMS